MDRADTSIREAPNKYKYAPEVIYPQLINRKSHNPVRDNFVFGEING